MLIRWMKVRPEDMMHALMDFDSSHSRVFYTVKQVMSFVNSLDKLWEEGSSEEQIQRKFVNKFTQLENDIDQKRSEIRTLCTELKEAVHDIQFPKPQPLSLPDFFIE